MSQTSTAAHSLHDGQSHEAKVDVEQASFEEQQNNTISSPTEEQDLEQTNAAPAAVHAAHSDSFPDGGAKAYLCLLGAACCLFCSFGWLNCVGVFQNYYQLHQLSNYSPSTIAWIPSVQLFIMFFPGPIVGWVYDNYGPRYLLIFGTFFHVFGLMMTSLCTKYYQFLLAQAICSPIGLNAIFQAGTSTIPTWFLKKRGLAYGIMAAGSGLGGVIFPIMASHLIPEVGFPWTIRIIAFLILGMLIVALLTVESRLPPTPRALALKVFVEPFKETKFVLLMIAAFVFFLGIFIPINYIEVEARHSGMSSRLASYLIPILNAGSIFGRIIPGALADKVGKFNMQAICSVLAGVIVLALAIPASTNAAWIAFAALYGIASGAFVSILPAQVAGISKVEQIGVRVGVTFCCCSFAGLFGAPIAGAIIDADKGKFWGMNVFAGTLLMAGAFMFFLERMYIANWQLAKRI
ncbi:hypothetical protein ACEQ8H_003722 [Pleosporales sp. CAS-2024a]